MEKDRVRTKFYFLYRRHIRGNDKVHGDTGGPIVL